MSMLQVITEQYADEELLKADGLDSAVIGIDPKSFRLIYSAEKILEILVTEEGMTYEDALEHYHYNIEGGWVGDKTPIWCYDII